jgi:lysyl-tRNA synthetase class 2
LRDLGIDPYPASANKEYPNREIVDHFDDFNGKKVSLTGRLMSYREHGAIAFGELQDESATIQLFIKNDTLKPTDSQTQTLGFSDLSLIDIGDFVEATGEVTKTSRGQISLLVETFKILTKSLRPLPDKREGLKDPELIFRRRYLDLTMNPGRREVFTRKAKFWEANRQFMKEHGFIEVETPVLEQVTGGADARPFVTFMNALGQDFYLRISTELYQKRLVGGGFEKVFTVGPNFRNEGISEEHLPEYYQIEWYWAYANYRDNMQLVQEMMRYVANAVYGRTKFKKHDLEFDLAHDWQEIDYADIIRERLGIDIFTDADEKMAQVLKKHGVVLEGAANRNRLIDNLWKVIRKTIAGPAFLVNEPKFMSPLAKSDPQRPELTERFHIVIAGSELGNGYSELNDPVDQYERFMDQQSQRNAGDDEAQMMDIDYVEMLEYGMPPTSGYAHSERLFWFLEDVTAREGTLFPHLRHAVTDETKQLYGLTDQQVGIKPSEKQASLTLPIRVIHKPVYFSIDPVVKTAFPTISVGMALIQNVKVTKTNPALEAEKARLLSGMNVQLEQIEVFKEIASYRRLYREMGVDLKKRRPSPEALLRRVAQGKELYTVNTAVDAYNLAVMRHRVSLGAFDADKIEFPTKLQFAHEGDEILLLGETEPTVYTAKELAYYDKLGGYNLDFNYRDAQRTQVTEQTTNLWLNAEGLYDISAFQVQAALHEAVTRILTICGGDVVFEGMVA